ncbi:hypothetical protein CERZMDRAFT_98533 [Cercospora zeae-maydis SCOH1-5]|uniref:Uncharacterized protein n=1 Tax=Cercospora zeae-maydis SCOH1-5 TaxID=717836 RepID=A0A6A6FCU2_9PEZI|nr:hypothetical protein CERZMDRAFT_98533 [Cercospora zeae-maydis SCOH1-5]
MNNDTASVTSSDSKKLSPTTMPTSKSIAFSDTASVVSAPINLPDGHQVTRANTVAGDLRPLNELHAHHIHARLASGERLDKAITSDSEGCLEYSNWGDEAEEAVRVGLAKLAQLARDQHLANPQKSVNEYYSERLSKLINEAEVELDVKLLK